MPRKFSYFVALALAGTFGAQGQAPVAVGGGSYAAFPPSYKSASTDHGGFRSAKIEGMKLLIDGDGERPIPTNDWWTDIINSDNNHPGGLWSYPQLLHSTGEGVTVHYPTYWSDNGEEVMPSSSILVSGRGFAPDRTIAKDWGDWHVVMRMPSADNSREMQVTMAHGMPFTWFEFEGNVAPELKFSDTPRFFNVDGMEGSRPRGNVLGVVIGNDVYGIYLPEGTTVGWREGKMTVSDDVPWMVIALLNRPADLEEYEPFAASVPVSTTVSWNYNERKADLRTSWQIKARSLRGGADAPVMQGFLPHAYKHTTRSFSFNGHEYLTPRGTMKMTESGLTGATHTFNYSYRFEGIMPYFAVPQPGNVAQNGYDPAIMKDLIDNYAAKGTFGADTYWGGKGLVQMALNMQFAKETGNTEAYELSKRNLRKAFENWLTYTPGEDNYFFAYYPRWRSLVGLDCSYDSDAFNDHHFHYGYYTYAGALLCLEDPDFKARYGGMLKELALDYANYDHNNTRYPFLRTMDPWAGHSYAGGLGDHLNDNGNGQESTSEAMQSWGGLYMLGVALGDTQMRDAGIFGYMTESNATAEYWFDRDGSRTRSTEGNYDYTKYTRPYNSNLTSKGIGWWTWFSGDDLWMHSIQWMPVSPCLNYLSKDLPFVKWDYETMLARSGRTEDAWWNPVTVGDDVRNALTNESVGNVVLCYMERALPEKAAEIFARAYAEGRGMARNIDTGHISYYTIQSHLTYGELDFEVYADCPTANAYRKADGTMTYMVYNPGQTDITVNFYRDGALEKTVKAAPGMTPFTDAPVASSIKLTPEANPAVYVAAGTSEKFTATVLDQYGVAVERPAAVTWTVTPASAATVAADGTLTVNRGTAQGTLITLTARAGSLTASATVNVNNKPFLKEAAISPAMQYVEAGETIDFTLAGTDQYGNAFDTSSASWSIKRDGREFSAEPSFTPELPGRYSVTVTSGTATFTHNFVVTPQLNNIALKGKATSSSEENAGTLTAAVNDGDSESRWGSAHTDDEWVYIDLGENAFISRVVVNWEAAFSAEYEVQLAPAGARMTNHTGNYFAGQQTVPVPADDQWTLTLPERASGAGYVTTAVGAEGRYVRIRNVKRGSAYGVSIKELGIYGIPASLGPDDIVGMTIEAPVAIDQHESATVAAKAYTLSGDARDVAVTWSADKEAAFSGNTFTPASYGIYRLTAATADGSTSEATVVVNEVRRITSLEVSPAESRITAGDSRTFEIKAFDQFGSQQDESALDLKVTLTTAAGAPVAANVAWFDLNNLSFTAREAGDYVLTFNDGAAVATVSAGLISDVNLALGKVATASSVQGDNNASMAVDGLTAAADGRYESQQEDNQWFMVDLDGLYMVNKVRLFWEGAFAKVYTIQTSIDGENWSDAFTEENGQGGNVENTFTDTPARYIRLALTKRATPYGFSFYEFEVYGSSRIELADSGEEPEISFFNVVTGNGDVTLSAAATHPQGFVNLQFDVLFDTGRVVTTRSAAGTSGQTHTLSLDGIVKDYDYVARVIATDLFGNQAIRTQSFTGKQDITGLNIALEKPAGSSGDENPALSVNFLNDDDPGTRWASLKEDEQWIKIDLGDVYPVEEVHILWEAAYSPDYDILLAIDDPDGINNDINDGNLLSRAGEEYTSVAHVTDAHAGEYIVSRLAAPAMARYVKVLCHKRAAEGWGCSIYDLKVFANNDLYQPTVDTTPSTEEEEEWEKMPDWDEWELPGDLEDTGTSIDSPVVESAQPVDVYTLNGTLVRRNVAPADATRHLLPGYYMVGREKVLVK